MEDRDAELIDQQIYHYLEMKRFTKVLELAHEGLSINPGDSKYYYFLGVCYFALDHYDEALINLQESIVLGYDQESVFKVMGDVYTEMKKWKEAEKCYLDSLRENPSNARAHAAYAHLMKETGHEEKAAQLMKMALELDPKDEYVIRTRYIFDLADDDRVEQIRMLGYYLQVASDQVSIEVNLGLHAIFRDDYKTAREHFRQAVLLDPTNKKLREVLHELDWGSHPILKPLQVMDRFGGPAVLYIVGMGAIFGAKALGWEEVTTVLVIVYISYVVYSWLAKPLAKFLAR